MYARVVKECALALTLNYENGKQETFLKQILDSVRVSAPANAEAKTE